MFASIASSTRDAEPSPADAVVPRQGPARPIVNGSREGSQAVAKGFPTTTATSRCLCQRGLTLQGTSGRSTSSDSPHAPLTSAVAGVDLSGPARSPIVHGSSDSAPGESAQTTRKEQRAGPGATPRPDCRVAWTSSDLPDPAPPPTQPAQPKGDGASARPPLIPRTKASFAWDQHPDAAACQDAICDSGRVDPGW